MTSSNAAPQIREMSTEIQIEDDEEAAAVTPKNKRVRVKMRTPPTRVLSAQAANTISNQSERELKENIDTRMVNTDTAIRNIVGLFCTEVTTSYVPVMIGTPGVFTGAEFDDVSIRNRVMHSLETFGAYMLQTTYIQPHNVFDVQKLYTKFEKACENLFARWVSMHELESKRLMFPWFRYVFSALARCGTLDSNSHIIMQHIDTWMNEGGVVRVCTKYDEFLSFLGMLECVCMIREEDRVDKKYMDLCTRLLAYATNLGSSTTSEVDVVRCIICAAQFKQVAPEILDSVRNNERLKSRVKHAYKYMEHLLDKTSPPPFLSVDEDAMHHYTGFTVTIVDATTRTIETHVNVFEKLGSGTYGAAFLTPYDGNDTDLRVLKRQPLKSSRLTLLIRERNIMTMLRHPNLVGLNRAFIYEQHAYIDMNHAEFGTLDRLPVTMDFASPERTTRVLPLHLVATQLLSAVEFLHSYNLVHGDIKGDNVFVYGNNLIKLADFGLAKRKSEVGPSWYAYDVDKFDRRMGTYAVERYGIREPVGYDPAATDWWAIGDTLDSMFDTSVKEPLYSGDRMEEMVKDHFLTYTYSANGREAGMELHFETNVKPAHDRYLDYVRMCGVDVDLASRFLGAIRTLMRPDWSKRSTADLKAWLESVKDGDRATFDFTGRAPRLNLTPTTDIRSDNDRFVRRSDAIHPKVSASELKSYVYADDVFNFYFDANTTPDLAYLDPKTRDELMKIL